MSKGVMNTIWRATDQGVTPQKAEVWGFTDQAILLFDNRRLYAVSWSDFERWYEIDRSGVGIDGKSQAKQGQNMAQNMMPRNVRKVY